MSVNRALLDMALPRTIAARMYDFWLELVAQGLGLVETMDEVSLDHRRHGANASGACHDIDSALALHPLLWFARRVASLHTQRSAYRR